MTLYDAPNQQVVRADGSAPWDEGTGGSPEGRAAKQETAEPAETEYDAMTKAELVELAQSRGISPANNDMTKAELVEALEA